MSQTKPQSLKNDVKFRFLAPGDVNEIKRLCHEWFPIELVSFCNIILQVKSKKFLIITNLFHKQYQYTSLVKCPFWCCSPFCLPLPPPFLFLSSLISLLLLSVSQPNLPLPLPLLSFFLMLSFHGQMERYYFLFYCPFLNSFMFS